jgi:hypothetical protein
VFDAQDDDFVSLIVDAVEDAIGAATCGVDSLQLTTEGLTNPVRVFSRSGPVMNSMAAAATAYGRCDLIARIEGGVRTSSKS